MMDIHILQAVLKFSSLCRCVVSCTLPSWYSIWLRWAFTFQLVTVEQFMVILVLIVHQLCVIREILPIWPESSLLLLLSWQELPWLLSMSLKFIVCGISGCVYSWWNFCLCCSVGIHIHMTGLNCALLG